MDLKKKVKGFFTLARKGDGGFTLVELIVVIAILAILGGVAVPAYSGYVKKAEIAADEALLNEVNMAFASACAINGQSHIGRTPKPTVSKNVIFKDDSPVVQESFYQFFEIESDPEFKTVAPRYNSTLGVFELKAVLNSNGNWNGLAALAETFNDSNFALGGGIPALTETIDDLAKVLALSGDGNVVQALKDMPGFQNVLDELGIPQDADPQTIANAAVFFVADKLSNKKDENGNPVITAGDLYTAMKEGNLNSYLLDNCDFDNANDAYFVETAIQYGMLQSYVNWVDENDDEDDPQTIDGIPVKEWFETHTPTNSTESAAFIAKLTDSNMYDYYIKKEAENDIETFVGVMNVVDDNTGAFEDLSGEGVFSNSDVQDVLTGNLLG